MATIDLVAYNKLGRVFGAANVSVKSVIAVTTAMTGVETIQVVADGAKTIVITT